MPGTTEERVDTLEHLLGQFIINNDAALRRMEKDTQELKKEMRAFKDEMKEFKDEMSDFKREMREDRKKAFEQWGNLANRIGTLAEDVVAPCVRSIAEKYFGCRDEDDFMVRRFKRKPKDRGSRREFDVIAVYDDAVVIADVKSTPRAQYIDDFVNVLKEFYDYFPEYKGKKLVPIFASLYLPDEVIAALTRNAIYAMATREDMMDLMNYEAVAAAMKKTS